MTLLNVIFQLGSTRIRTGVAGFKVPSDNHLHYKTKKATIGSRTLDLILTKDMLCQLSYSGKKIFVFIKFIKFIFLSFYFKGSLHFFISFLKVHYIFYFI